MVGFWLSRQIYASLINRGLAADLCSCPSHGLGLAFVFMVSAVFKTTVLVLCGAFALTFGSVARGSSCFEATVTGLGGN